MNSKNLKLLLFWRSGNNVLQFNQKSMETLSTYEKAISRATWYRDDLGGSVINLSKHSFTKKQIKVLNKNLNLCSTSGYYNKKEIKNNI